jgi:hypothetical protein
MEIDAIVNRILDHLETVVENELEAAMIDPKSSNFVEIEVWNSLYDEIGKRVGAENR